MRRRPFEQHSAWVARSLVVAAAELVVLALFVFALRVGWLAVDRPMRTTLVLGLAIAPVVNLATALPAWSQHSHELGVAHGMIPRRSSGWARWSWLVPGANLFVPFAMLRERWRFYRCAGRSPIADAQALLALSLLALAGSALSTALLLFGLWGAWGCLQLRRAIRTIAAAQVQAEREATAETVFG